MSSRQRRNDSAPQYLDATTLTAWRNVRDAGEVVVSRISAEMENQSGLSLDWYGILLHIYEGGEDGRLPQRELERHLYLSQSGISRMVSKMQEAGLLRREPSPHDRRNVYVVLTDLGRDVFLRATPVHHAAVQRHFGSWLSDDEIASIGRGLQKVLTAEGGSEIQCGEELDRLVTFGQSVLALTSDTVAVSDAILVRDALEPLLLADAARHVTPSAVQDMRAIVARMSTLIDSPEEFFRSDWELHRLLAGYCHNELLRSMYLTLLGTLSSRLDSVVPTTNLTPYLYERLSVHARLVEAVSSGDEDQVAEAAHAHHFTMARTRLVDAPGE
ncbi:FCD domain-containing protein [Streptomyces mirabilis]|uniref:FCD domain-containing protein n=1 Tax=Streptomyces mirabilis TaxID=68239 RepID=UPI00365A1433